MKTSILLALSAIFITSSAFIVSLEENNPKILSCDACKGKK